MRVCSTLLGPGARRPDASPAVRGVYKPRRPQASPLVRLVSDHLHRLQTVYDDRSAREYGPRRPVVTQVANKFLVCGVLDYGFAANLDGITGPKEWQMRGTGGDAKDQSTQANSISHGSPWWCIRKIRFGAAFDG